MTNEPNHKPNCSIHQKCLAYHENRVCSGYKKCDCGYDFTPAVETGSPHTISFELLNRMEKQAAKDFYKLTPAEAAMGVQSPANQPAPKEGSEKCTGDCIRLGEECPIHNPRVETGSPQIYEGSDKREVIIKGEHYGKRYKPLSFPPATTPQGWIDKANEYFARNKVDIGNTKEVGYSFPNAAIFEEMVSHLLAEVEAAAHKEEEDATIQELARARQEGYERGMEKALKMLQEELYAPEDKQTGCEAHGVDVQCSDCKRSTSGICGQHILVCFSECIHDFQVEDFSPDQADIKCIKCGKKK